MASAAAPPPVAAAPPEDKVMKEVCSTQGIDEEKLARVAPVLRKFDIFQPVEFESWALAPFTGLEDLCVVQAPKFGRMSSLRCFRLESLTLIECGIKRIEGLESCISLRRLCLDGNHLASLAGIEQLTSLTHLHVNDNRLASLAGVSRCTLLRELWAASNQISSIGDSLDGLTVLETMNLSANALGTFQDIANLARLPALKHLSLADQHWGDNPVCSLCNYATYVLYQLPGLVTMDAAYVLDDAKAASESTFVKKRMYYNMRVKTLRRNVSAATSAASAAASAAAALLGAPLPALRHAAKVLECVTSGTGAEETSAAAASSRGGSSGRPVESAAAAKLGAILNVVAARERSIAAVEDAAVAMKAAARALTTAHASRMSLELFTGGNIRLEEGRPPPSSLLTSAVAAAAAAARPGPGGGASPLTGAASALAGVTPSSLAGDVWYSTCADLVRSRFSAADFAPLHVTGVRVLRAIRVHNRYLRSRFEKRITHVLGLQPGLTAGLAAWHAATASGAAVPPTSPTRGAAPSETPGTTRAAGKKGIEYVLFSPSWTAGSVAAAVNEGMADASGRGGKAAGGVVGAATARPGTGRQGAQPSVVGSSTVVGSVVPLLNEVFGGGPDVQAIAGGAGPAAGIDADSDGEDEDRTPGTHAPPLISSLSRQANAQLQRIVEHGFGAMDAVVTAPVSAVPLNYYVAQPPSYARANASFGPRRARSAGNIDTSSLASPTGASSPTRGESLGGFAGESDDAGVDATLLPCDPRNRGLGLAIPVAGNIAGADLPRLAETVAAVLERSPSLGWTRPPVTQALPPRPAAVVGSPSSTRLPPRPGPLVPEENSTAASYNVFKPGGGRAGWDPPGRGGDAGVPAPTRWLRASGLDPTGISVKTSLSRALRAETVAPSTPTAGGAGAAPTTAAAASTKAPPLSSRTIVRRGALLIAKAFVGNCLDAESGRTALSYAPTPNSASFTGLSGAAGDRTVHSVCGSRRDDPKQRAWFFLDPGLLLPEYIVEYEYTFEGEEPEARAPPATAAADSAGDSGPGVPQPLAVNTAGLPTVELVARCGHRVPMTVQLRSLVDAARLLAIAAQSWLSAEAPPAPAWQHLVRQLRGVPGLQLSAAEEADIRGLVPATNAFLGVLARAASVVSGLALVSPSSLTLLGNGGLTLGGGLRGALANRPRGRAEAVARRAAASSKLSDSAGDSAPQAVDQEAVTLLSSKPLTFSFRLGAALGADGAPSGGRDLMRLPATPRLDDHGPSADAAAAAECASSWWLTAMRRGYALASSGRGGRRSSADGSPAATPGSPSQQHAWPAIPFSDPPLPGLASAVTAVDAAGRSVASLPAPTSFSSSLQPSLSSVVELHLPDCGLTRLDSLGLAACTALRVLDVSFNSLASLQGVGACPLLLRLDASHNDLQGLGGPPPMPSWSQHSVRPVAPGTSDDSSAPRVSSSLLGCTLLQFLNISCNSISLLESVLIAAPFCPGLLSLDLRNNPLCCKHANAAGAAAPQGWESAGWAISDAGAESNAPPPGYLPSLLVYFPMLATVDGRTIAPEVRSTSLAVNSYRVRTRLPGWMTAAAAAAAAARPMPLVAGAVAPPVAWTENLTKMQARSLCDVMHTRITRRLIRRLGMDSHARLVWPATSAAAGGGANADPSAGAAGRASTGPGGDRLSLGAATPLGGVVDASNASAVSARTTESEGGGRPLTRAPPTIAALAAPADAEDDDDDDGDNDAGSGDDDGLLRGGVRDGYAFELPEDDASRPVSSVPTQQALRDAAALGRKLNAAARASLVRLTRAGEVTARLELRWSAITSLDLSHAFIPEGAIFERAAVDACACLTGLKTLRLAGNMLHTLVQVPASAPSLARQHRLGLAAGGAASTSSVALAIPGGGTFLPPVLSIFSVLLSLEWLVLEDCALSTLATDLPASLAASTASSTAGGADSMTPTPGSSSGRSDGKRERASPLQMWFSPLTALRHLTKLELGNNRLTDAALVAGRLYLLPQLALLSVENNLLTSFAGIAGCKGLMELYVSNNHVGGGSSVGGDDTAGGSEDASSSADAAAAATANAAAEQLLPHASLRLVLALRPEQLPKLIILDLSGNALTQQHRYRDYTIFHLRRLKVLDGVGINNDERSAVTDRYSGRVTIEVLEERLLAVQATASAAEAAATGGTPPPLPPLPTPPAALVTMLTGLKDLDLTNSRMREFDHLPPALFRSLCVANLDYNGFTPLGLRGVRDLPRLQALSLSNNRCTTLLPILASDAAVASQLAADSSTAPQRLTPSVPPPPFVNLEVLSLAHNGITDMSAVGLEWLPRMRVLNLAQNDISRVTGLARASHLRSLCLDGNSIRFIEADSFAGCGALVELRLADNNLRTLAHLDVCRGLQVLAANANRIPELAELDALAALPRLQELALQNNPVARKHLYRQLAIFKLPQVSLLDGKDVSVEERYRSESMFTGTAGGPMAGPMTGVLAGPPTGASAGMSMPGQPPYGPSHMQSSGGPSMQPPLMQTGMMSWQQAAAAVAQQAGMAVLPQISGVGSGGLPVSGSGFSVGSTAGSSSASSQQQQQQVSMQPPGLAPMAHYPRGGSGGGGGFAPFTTVVVPQQQAPIVAPTPLVPGASGTSSAAAAGASAARPSAMGFAPSGGGGSGGGLAVTGLMIGSVPFGQRGAGGGATAGGFSGPVLGAGLPSAASGGSAAARGGAGAFGGAQRQGPR